MVDTNTHDSEHQLIWAAIEDANTFRIAGDAALNSSILGVNSKVDINASSISTEVIAREQGDLRQLGMYDELGSLLSTTTTDLLSQITNVSVEHQQDISELTSTLNNAIGGFDHQYLILTNRINAETLARDTQYTALDNRVKNYEDILSDITADSTQITADNGQINAGAWTILSQAREWDLEILSKVNKFQSDTQISIDAGLQDIINQLPVEQQIINNTLGQLSQSQVIQDLDSYIGAVEGSVNSLTNTVNNQAIQFQQEMVALAQDTLGKITQETNQRQQDLQLESTKRVEDIQREAAIRSQAVLDLEDGLTVETTQRIEGDQELYESIQVLKSSNETALADVYQKISVNTTNISANATAIDQVDAKVDVAQSDASTALTNAATALTTANSAADATSALSNRTDLVEASITTINGELSNKVSTTTFNELSAEVETLDGRITTNSSDITAINGNLTGLGNTVTVQGQAIDNLGLVQTQQGSEISSLATQTNSLQTKLNTVEGSVLANTTAISDTSALVQQHGNDITSLTNSTNTLSAKVNGLKSGGDNLLKNSSEAIVWNPSAPLYPHGMYYMSEPWVVGQKYTLTICVSHSSAGGATSLGVFAGGGHGNNVITTFTNTNKEVRTITFTKNAENSDNPAIVFFHLSYSSDPNAQTTVHWAVMTEGESIGVDSWKPGNGDLVAMGEGSATAINNLQAQVTTLDGRITATGNSLLDLQSTVNNNQASLINNYYTKSAANEAMSGQITKFESTLALGKGYMDIGRAGSYLRVETGQGVVSEVVADTNSYRFTVTADGSCSHYYALCFNNTDVPIGTKFTISGYIRTSRAGLIDRIYCRYNQYTSDSYIYTNKVGTDWYYFSTTGITGGNWASDEFLNLFGAYMPNSVYGDWLEFKNVQVVHGDFDTRLVGVDQARKIEANATAVSSLTATVSDIDGRVTSNASQVITLSSTVNNIPSGSGNLLLNSDFTLQNLDFWGIAAQGAPTENRVLLGNELADWQAHAGQSKTLQLHTLGNIDAANNYYTEVYQDIAIEGGKSYQISAYTGAHRTIGYIFVYFINYQGSLLNHTHGMQPTTSINNNEKIGGNFLANFKRIYQNVTAPGDATSMRIVIRMMAHNDSYLFVTRCAATEVTGSTAALAPWSDSSGSLVYKTNNQQVVINQNTSAIDGVKAVSTVSVNNNGFISGYGLISQLVNGVVQSAFGVNADYFYVGTSTSNQKKPFMVLTSPQTIGGVTYPAGTWMDVALIANATIGTAHIADASITNAKIASLDASKITTGTLDANRIAANTITADKLVIGDTTNLWGNQFFLASGPRVMNNNGRVNHVGYITELKGWGAQCFGRDHIAPWTTRIPVKAGDTMVIEFSGGHNAGPLRDVGVGLWYLNGQGVTVALAYPRLFAIESLGSGWNRYRHTFTVPNDPTIAYALLFVQIEQSENEADPMYWTIGNTSIRKAMGGELIVNGAVTAEKISVNSLSAVSANLGTLVTYKDPAQPLKARMVMQGSLITVYDDNNVVRVKLGLW